MNLEDCDYFTNNTISVLRKNFTIPMLIVLTPHKSQSSDWNFTYETSKRTRSEILKITPKDFSELIKSNETFTNFLRSVSHLIIEDCDLMEDFGYTKYLEEIKNDFFFIYIKYTKKTNLTHLNFNKYVINCNKEDYYYYLYLLYLKHGDKIVILCKNQKKMNFFCQILKMGCKIDTTYKEEYFDKMCLVVEEYKEIDNIVIYIGLNCTGNPIKITENTKLQYRIRDLVKCLSKDIVNGKRKGHFSRFENIHKK